VAVKKDDGFNKSGHYIFCDTPPAMVSLKSNVVGGRFQWEQGHTVKGVLVPPFPNIHIGFA